VGFAYIIKLLILIIIAYFAQPDTGAARMPLGRGAMIQRMMQMHSQQPTPVVSPLPSAMPSGDQGQLFVFTLLLYNLY
jgi:hypothetical protein